jgi:two-component system, cell cycle response regulator
MAESIDTRSGCAPFRNKDALMVEPGDDDRQTVRREIHVPRSNSRREAILVHIYPTGPQMGQRYVIGADPLVIGRGDTCDVFINDSSVSRRHATVAVSPAGVTVADLGSTNGTFVNNTLVTEAILGDGDYLRVGNCIYRFLTGDNVEAEYHEEIYRLTITDALTEIHNKRYLLDFLERELARSQRHNRPLSLVLFDIDRFKALNDSLGHLAGDYALRELAACVRAGVRREELFARYGGEEFAVVLPETACAAAAHFAERVRSAVEGHVFEYDGNRFPVTISLGIASTTGDGACTVQGLIQQADKAMYRAKNEGRNRVCVGAPAEAGTALGG